MAESAGKGITASSRAAEKLSFDRKRFAPYLSKFKSDKEIEDLFLEFLRQRSSVQP